MVQKGVIEDRRRCEEGESEEFKEIEVNFYIINIFREKFF